MYNLIITVEDKSVFNICNELKCPHYSRSTASCSYFASARCCPVGLLGGGVQKDNLRGVVGFSVKVGQKNPNIDLNLAQTYLIAQKPASIDINSLREILESKVLSDERSQDILKLRSNDF